MFRNLGLAMLSSLVTVVATQGVASAQSTPAPTPYATLVCRAARTGEQPNAMMVANTTPLLCKTIDPRGSMKTIATVEAKTPRELGPNLSMALSSQQTNDAWERYLQQTFNIDRSS